jgi:hypothetical protein
LISIIYEIILIPSGFLYFENILLRIEMDACAIRHDETNTLPYIKILVQNLSKKFPS